MSPYGGSCSEVRYGADSFAQPRPDWSRRISAWKPGAPTPFFGSGRPMWSITTSVGKLPRKRVEVGMILDVEQELHVPAEVLDALGELARHLERQSGLGGAVDAEAAHAAVGEIAQRAVGDVLADQRDGAKPFRDAP